MILSNQTLKVEELTLQRTNIINFLLGRNPTQMSRLLVGDEKTLTDTTLKAGRFIFLGNGRSLRCRCHFSSLTTIKNLHLAGGGFMKQIARLDYLDLQIYDEQKIS